MRCLLQKVVKRDGSIEDFDSNKIKEAILKAVNAVEENPAIAEESKNEVILLLNNIFGRKTIPNIEQIQDLVEAVLEKKSERVYKAYSLYRRSRHIARELKNYFKIKDDLKLSINAIKVLEERYLQRDSEGNINETPTKLFKRVAKAVAEADFKYNTYKPEIEQKFFQIMSNLEFLPNSPTLMNAGTQTGQLSACFVLPIEDSLDSIFSTLKNTVIIQKYGGGTGFNFSNIRPRGDIVKSTKGIASGPVSFLKIYDQTTEVIKQGGKRRGANMGILNVNHPDILEFIDSKINSVSLSNFNISVAITDEFLELVKKNREISLINPRNSFVVRKLNAKMIFDKIVSNAWKNGDPGMIFLDTINKANPLENKIEATNPCGEVPLLPYESCNLGSINLSKMLKKERKGYSIDWKKFEETIRIGVHFLDNVIDVNHYPTPEIEKATKDTRKIGLGIMGFADMLIKLKIPYESKKALKIAEQIMKFMEKIAREESELLGKQRGSFPLFNKSKLASKYKTMRNATVTTIAPTGTISIIANCSSGIEPLFAIAFYRHVMEGKNLVEIHPEFQLELIKRGIYSEKLIKKIVKTGSFKGINLPKDLKEIFKTALDIKPEHHIRIQAVFQKYTDNAVSKTVNLPESATKKDVEKIFLLAHKLGCKGITIYRYNSKPEQVLYLGSRGKPSKADLFYSGGCISSYCHL